MNPLHAGLMCTLLLIGTIAGLLSCMSAVRCHRRFAFAICLTIASLDFAALAILLSRLPESAALSPAPWTAAALLLSTLSLSALFLLRRKKQAAAFAGFHQGKLRPFAKCAVFCVGKRSALPEEP